jgi:orotidine-5'-phosphate decarboxylase
LEPFIQYRDRGIFILCRTSNAGAMDFQSLSIETEAGPKKLFEIVAEKVDEWNKYGNLGLVVGATYPDELKLMRQRYPEMPLLIPGVGAQGGELAQVVSYGVDAGRRRTIINSSRQILYASKGKDFAKAAGRAAKEMRDKINDYLANAVG